MKKQFKKLTLVTTAAFLFLLTAVSGTLKPLPVSPISVDTEEDAEPTPIPEEPELKPMADEAEGDDRIKTK